MCGYNSSVFFCASHCPHQHPHSLTLSRHTFSNLCLLMCPLLLCILCPTVITIQCPPHFIFNMTNLRGHEKMQLVTWKKKSEFINLVGLRRNFSVLSLVSLKSWGLLRAASLLILSWLLSFSCGLVQPKFAMTVFAHLSWLHPNREEELLAAAEVPEGSERRRFQHAGERDIEADYPSGQGDGDDGGPQTVSHRDELNSNVRKLHH